MGVRDVTIHSLRRLEGASDQADEVSVAAVDVDGYGKGTIVLRHGPAASLAEVQLLAAARDGGWLVPDALAVVEEAADAGFKAPEGFMELERRKYDDTEFVFLRAS